MTINERMWQRRKEYIVHINRSTYDLMIAKARELIARPLPSDNMLGRRMLQALRADFEELNR